MTKMRKPVIILATAVLALLGASCNKLKSRDQLNQGVQAFRNAEFPDAVEHFKKAVELDPNYSTARLYLATAYMQQYVPGADSPENNQFWDAAYAQFKTVVDQDDKNSVANASIASLYFNRQNWAEARRWYTKVIAIEPTNKEAYYSLGVIAYKEWHPDFNTERVALKMKEDDKFPFKDKKANAELNEKYGPIIDEGLKNLDKCLEIDPEYEDAMTYKNLLIRERAYLADNKEDFDAQAKVADKWEEQALATIKIKADRKSKKTGGGIVADTDATK
jgi:tetratricopeptide (TPR) repeat protein